jgi:hypothetical protein
MRCPDRLAHPWRVRSYGDYQIDEYEWMWERDFALMKAMGANTIRTYAWNVTYNHTRFLDKANEHGLMVCTLHSASGLVAILRWGQVLVTFYMGTTRTRPYYKKPFTDAISDFVGQVTKYLDHPAILMWGTLFCSHPLRDGRVVTYRFRHRLWQRAQSSGQRLLGRHRRCAMATLERRDVNVVNGL